MEYTCSTCKRTKTESAFGISKTHATGRNPRCKECCNKAAKQILARKRDSLSERITLLEKRIAALEPIAVMLSEAA
jgi:DNA-directed RNA polymerase subunit RPC12/RpoP